MILLREIKISPQFRSCNKNLLPGIKIMELCMLSVSRPSYSVKDGRISQNQTLTETIYKCFLLMPGFEENLDYFPMKNKSNSSQKIKN